MRVEPERLPLADAVDPQRERARGGDRRVLLAQRPGGCVARVRGELLVRAGQPLVQLTEPRERQVDLAAHLEHRGRVVSEHPQRHRGDRAQVDGHVLALDAVAAGRASDEHAVRVGQVDREPVDLRLDHVGDGLVPPLGSNAEPPTHVVSPLRDRLVGRDLLERPHRRQVLHLDELLRRGRADALGRRVGRHELRMLALERRQLVVGTVVLGVGHGRLVEDVVLVRPAVQPVAQLGGALRGLQGAPRAWRRSRPRRRRRASRPR